MDEMYLVTHTFDLNVSILGIIYQVNNLECQ